ncbi:MAG: hypothetical protein JO352_16060 [Chloroflexi bacterium]|nr:hypothetical protein [Chloroflexota bacterium]MBV9600259.1 hypothetical protein [Chloroflexota bacterium]
MQSLAELALKMHESVDLTDEREVKKFIGFTQVGENLIGVRRRATRLMEEDALEIGPGGIVTPRRDPFGLYIIYGGTPHHTCNLFGYWHINDVDEVYITVGGKNPDDEATRLILMRYPKSGERDMFAWYCRECVALLHCFVHETGSLGFETFWKAESEAVRIFNSDATLRRCKNCGAEHPLGYRFMANKNSVEEEAARRIW